MAVQGSRQPRRHVSPLGAPLFPAVFSGHTRCARRRRQLARTPHQRRNSTMGRTKSTSRRQSAARSEVGCVRRVPGVTSRKPDPGVMRQRRSTDFASRVLAAVCRIPPGRIATYGDIARVAGRPRAARAVGNIMRACSQPNVPCHRVVAAGGRLGGYGGNIGLKRNLLRAEGLNVVGSNIRDADAFRWPARPRPSGARKRDRRISC